MRARGGWSSFEAQPTLKAGAAVQQAPKATWLRVVLLPPPYNLRSARLTRASDCKGTIFATPPGATPSVSFDGLKKNMAQFATLSLPHPTPHLTRSMQEVVQCAACDARAQAPLQRLAPHRPLHERVSNTRSERA